MADPSQLRHLLSLLADQKDYKYAEGLHAFHALLRKDVNGHVLRFLNRQLRSLRGKARGGVAYVVAGHYREVSNLNRLRKLYAIGDAEVQESVLFALWGRPGPNPRMGPGIVQLAVEATSHPVPAVRTGACFVFQNQAAYGVDVSPAVDPLRSLLADRSGRVRSQAAYAVGNLARRRYDMSRHVSPLRRNLTHKDMFVRESSAWALSKLACFKHDIGSVVPDLVLLLEKDEYDAARKNAAGVLLHYAKKSAANAIQVKQAVEGANLDSRQKEIHKLVNQLVALR
jgi:hypothetical protein